MATAPLHRERSGVVSVGPLFAAPSAPTAPTPEGTTSLDPLETPVEPQDAPPPLASLDDRTDDAGGSPADWLVWSWRHNGWRRRRQQVYDALIETAGTLGWRRLEAFAECGASYWVQRSKNRPEVHRLVPDCCHDRMCLPCQQKRSETLAGNITRWVGQRPCRTLGLTIAASPTPLAAQLDHLQASYRRLRQRDSWKARVQGAIAIIEVTRNADTGHWHPHLHVIAWGAYWPQAQLSAEWEQASKGSPIVDIRLVREPRQLAHYVSKYVAKCLDSSVYEDHAALCEYVLAMKGRRLIITSGDATKAHLTEEPGEDDWCTLGHWRELLAGGKKAEGLDELVRAIALCPIRATSGEWTLGDLLPWAKAEPPPTSP